MRGLAFWYAWCLMLAVMALAAVPCAASPAAAAAPETVRTEDGLVTVWHRAPALESDLAMPFLTNGMVIDSFVYRVRDRKKRDLLRYARAIISTTAPTADIIGIYQKALGRDAVMETDKTTGDITFSAGEPEDFRLVTISLPAGYTRIRLERVQRFSIPPRVFTAEEQRVQRVLEEVAAVYRTARQVSYHVEQRMPPTGDTPAAPGASTAPQALEWAFEFTRPDRLHLTAKMGEITGLSITAEDGTMKVTRQVGDPVTTPFDGKITTELIPELREDPVARLVLDGEPLTIGADYMAILSVTQAEAGRIAEIALTYPERNTKLFLTIDLRSKLILRSESEVSAGEKATRMARTYSAVMLDAVSLPAAVPTPSPLPSQPDASAAVTGP